MFQLISKNVSVKDILSAHIEQDIALSLSIPLRTFNDKMQLAFCDPSFISFGFLGFAWNDSAGHGQTAASLTTSIKMLCPTPNKFLPETKNQSPNAETCISH